MTVAIIIHYCPVNYIWLLAKPLLALNKQMVCVIRDINFDLQTLTRCEHIRVRSNAASMRHTVTVCRSKFMPLTVNGTAVIIIV